MTAGPGAPGGRGPLRLRPPLGPALAVVLLVLPLVACTFDRRPDLVEAEAETAGGPEAPEEVAGPPEPPDPEREPRAVVDLFREAVATGDLTLALRLLDPDAVLVDAGQGETGEELTRGELLLEIRALHGEGLRFEVLDSRVSVVGETALVVTRLALLRGDEEEAGGEVGRAYETVLLTSTPEGWRIHHLHRSPLPPL